MFLFKDVLEQLENAEISLTNLTNKEGVIPNENFNKILGFLNTALSDLHTRLTLVKGQCVIQTKEGKHSYTISKENAQTVDPVNGFIMDSTEFPFNHTVLELIGVSSIHNHALRFNQLDTTDFVSDYNIEKSYNLDDCVRTFNSPKFGVLRTPLGLRDSLLKVNYKVGHTPYPMIPEVDLPTFDAETIVIDLPFTFLMPVVFYICSRVNNRRGSERAGNSIRDEGSAFFGKYLSEVNTIKANMSQATETTTPVDIFRQRGFV